MAEEPWNRSFRLVGPGDLPPEDWDMIGAFYIPNDRTPPPFAQRAPARNPDPWAAFPDAPPQAPQPNNLSASRRDNMGYCLPQYVRCQDLHGNALLHEGKRCQDCYDMCNL